MNPKLDPLLHRGVAETSLEHLSASQKGYISDPLVQFFVSEGKSSSPIMARVNIETYLRSTAIDDLIDDWLDRCETAGKTAQVVSLGAGYDTRFWRLISGRKAVALEKYFELDLPEVTSQKTAIIRNNAELSVPLGDEPIYVTCQNGGKMIQSPKYSLYPVDLGESPEETDLGRVLGPPSSLAHMDPSIPTLLLLECVVGYILPPATEKLFQWFTDYFQRTPLGVVMYDSFAMSDSFGSYTLSQLKKRGISLPGLEPFHNVSAFEAFFRNNGFLTTHAMTLYKHRKECISASELQRITELEPLDRDALRTLDRTLQHLAVAWGLKTSSSTVSDTWEGWGYKSVK